MRGARWNTEGWLVVVVTVTPVCRQDTGSLAGASVGTGSRVLCHCWSRLGLHRAYRYPARSRNTRAAAAAAQARGCETPDTADGEVP